MPASLKHLTDKKVNLTSLLARWNDGLYYSAAIVRCDKINKKCLVCFEDGSEVWMNNRDIHLQLSSEQLYEDEDIVCCICDDGNSEAPNEIILCDVCQQGYHQKCHNPPVDSSKIDESEDTDEHKDWFCATCSYILNQSDRAKLSATAQQQEQQQQQQQPKQLQKQKQTHLQEPDQLDIPPAKQPKLRSQSTPSSQPSKNQSQRQQQQSQPITPQPTQQIPKQAKAVKSSLSPQSNQKSTSSPIKIAAVSHVQKSAAPNYPLSNQARAVATSSTAALASMTASSALVVGSSAGRTKQDLVNQSNRSSQKQQRSPVANETTVSTPVKHAVRKSSSNFVMAARKSALPIATRSIPNSVSPAKIPELITNTSTSSVRQQLITPKVTSNAVSSHPVSSAVKSNTSIERSNIQDNSTLTSKQKINDSLTVDGDSEPSLVNKNSSSNHGIDKTVEVSNKERSSLLSSTGSTCEASTNLSITSDASTISYSNDNSNSTATSSSATQINTDSSSSSTELSVKEADSK